MENIYLCIEVKKWLIMAERFKNAAYLCLNEGFSFEHSPQIPGAYLTAFSIELYLKSFLFYKHGSEGKNIQEISSMLKKISHGLKDILNKCVECDNNFEELIAVIDQYEKYSFLKYPDEMDKILYDKDKTIEISSTFTKDIEKVESFVNQRIPIEIQKIERHN